MKKIGIIGKGFVGSAVEFGFSAQTGCDAELRTYDIDPTKSTHALKETVNGAGSVIETKLVSVQPLSSLTNINKCVLPVVSVGAVSAFHFTLAGHVTVPLECLSSKVKDVTVPEDAGLAKVNVLLPEIVLVK